LGTISKTITKRNRPERLAKIDAKLMTHAGLNVKKENFRIAFSNTIYTFTSASSNFRLTTYAFK
jgi:hypothetical protein